MPDTGMFHLYDVRFSAEAAIPTIEFIRAQCSACRGIFRASERPLLENIPGGGAILTCPACSRRQAISGARFVEFAARFPMGNAEGSNPLATPVPGEGA